MATCCGRLLHELRLVVYGLPRIYWNLLRQDLLETAGAPILYSAGRSGILVTLRFLMPPWRCGFFFLRFLVQFIRIRIAPIALRHQFGMRLRKKTEFVILLIRRCFQQAPECYRLRAAVNSHWLRTRRHLIHKTLLIQGRNGWLMRGHAQREAIHCRHSRTTWGEEIRAL